MATVFEECSTKELRSVVHFLWEKQLMQRMFLKKCFLFIVGSVCHVKQLTTGLRNSEEYSKVTDYARPGAEVAETIVKRLLTHW
jgi:hypothetical protein